MKISFLFTALFIITLQLPALGAAAKKETQKMSTSPDDMTKEDSNEMKIVKASEQVATDGPAEYFTGSVKVTPLVKGEAPSCLSCASVGFQPGARSAWHTHPKGQLLIVTEGSGLIQEWGKPVRRIQKGDHIWTPPGVKHWHGASPDSAMTHTAINELENGKAVDWMEKVTDSEYTAKPTSAK